MEERTNGTLHQAVRKPAGVRLPLLRSNCHPRLPERTVATRTGRLFLPRRGRREGRRQGGAESAHRGVSGLGRGIRSQSRHAHRVGREGCAQGGPRSTMAALDDAFAFLWRLFHLQEHGAGADVSLHGCEVSDQGSKPPHPRSPAAPFHALLLLHSRRGPGPHRDARGLVLSIPDHVLSQRPLLHRAGVESLRRRLSQERQRVSGRR